MEEKGRRSRRDVLTDGNSSFLRAARAGNLDKVLEWLKGSIDINTSNANGLNALHLASKEGHINVVTELIKRGANVNAATKKGNTALHISSLAGKQEVVKILVQNGANVNVQSQNGFTPLYMAAQENHDDVLSFLLANGANQSLSTEDGFTPLAVALQQGHDKVVTILLENDTKGKVRLPALHIAAKKDDCKAATLLLQSDHNPDVTSKSGFTPLHIAAHYGNENIAMILLEKGADVNFTAKHQITPLHVAAKWGKSNMVALLLEKGAKIGASTRDGLTPLHCAARSGHETVVDQLLENGAPISAKTKNGLAPLHMSSQGDHVDSARILLYHKAPVDDVTVDYLTALHVAAHCGHVNVAKLLLDRNADPNARALNGFTPLHIACKKNRIKVVELLLKHGASIEATTESGLTPLHVASFMGCMNIVIFLLQNGANPDVPTVRGETPLHLAARANQTDIIRILLRNGAHVDAPAREEQTPLHIAARLGNVDIVSLLLQHGAAVDATTKDMYTALHVAAKEGQEEVASVLLDHGASLTAATKKGFTPLHMAAKYGNIKVARLLLHKDAPVDAQGKNGVTPLHVAAHYDHVNVALLLLDKGASPHATAKNGYTPLHIASKKNQMDISTTLLEYGAKANTESKAGFTSLHLAAQEGHTDMATLLIEHNADVNARAKNGLTPLHLCAQEDRVNVAEILVKNGAEIDPQTKAEYSPLHVACHFGQINMVRFLLQHGANVNSTTSYGYTPLHQAAQQGHNLIINLLLENQASPNIVSTQGQTPLSIAQRLGYISVVETLKVVTETVVTTTTTTVIEEKYKVVAPETMQETFMSDSEDDGGEETMLGDQSYRYLTADEMKSLGDDSLPIDVTKDERPTESMMLMKESSAAPLTIEEDHLSPQHSQMIESALYGSYSPDNVDISLTSVAPISAGRLKWKTFLVSFMVDARGGAMRGCRHSGVRVIIPPRKASMPMRITCRYLRKEKLAHPPPLMEGEACASRILEVGPVGARFLGPVIIEVPHFASLRGKEREITILRSDNGETWRDHTLEASEEAVQEVLSDSFDGEELSALEDLNTNRITRILTTDFPQYFAIITRIRQEVHAIGPEGGMVTSTVVPQVQAIFPEGALTKKIKVGLQAQPIQPDLVTKLLGNSVAVSPIVTVEPRRRKFHKPITLTIPVPQAATKGMINQYSGDAPTLRLLCSITGSSKSGGSSKAQWEDVTGSTPLTLVNECISFTTTVSARFWLMDCRQVNEATKFATELYQEVIHVPFMGKFVIFAKRYDTLEAQLRVFCMTDDKEDKTLESQEHFTEIAKSRDVEVLQNKPQYLEFAGNLVPITKSGDQLFLTFHAFRENRLPFSIRIKDPLQEPMGRIAFMKEPKVGRGEPQPVPICNLNIALPEVCKMDNISELVTLEKKYCFVQETGLAKPELIHRADLRLSDIARELDGDWEILALQLDISETEINSIKSDYPDDDRQQALIMLRQWMQKSGPKATGNSLEKALRKIRRDDIVKQCMFNVELVTDAVEKAVAKVHLDQSGFDTFKEELGSSRDASLRREVSLDVSYDEQDLIKETVHMTENGAEIIEKQIVSDEFVKEPAQAAKITQDQREEKAVKYISSVTVETQEVIRENVVKQGATETATTIVMEGEEVSEHDVHDHTAKLVESETWASEMDTSQVSISSLPEDEKSEPTTATISSSIAAEPESAAAEASTEEKEHDLEKQVIPSDQDDSSSQDRTIEEQISEEKQVMEDLVASTLPSVTKETLELALTKRFDENLKTSVVQKKMISDEKVTDISISANKEDIYKITKEKEIISDERKQEEKSPQHVDRGLSPIAVYTAYPGDIRREGSEFFIKTYDAPTMQEPVTSYLGKSIKENIIRSKSISINEDTRPLEILLDRKILDMDEGRATSESKLTLVNPPITKTLDIHFKTESHIRITHRTKDEKEELSPEHISLPSDKNMVTEIENLPSSPVLQTDQASSPINIESPLKTEIIKSPSLTEEDISKGIGLQESFELSEEIYEKSEIATSPMSDHLLDTGVGTESPVTTETASSPFQFETKSVAVSPHDSAADISFPKEDSSTQTTLVDTVSAHTSPMDLSLSFQDALLDQQIQLGVADIESQDEIETPGTEILDDEELEDKFAQESLPETKEQALALKSEAISTQEKLKLMKQNDFERSKDVKLIQTYKFVTTQRKDVDSIDKSIKQETVLKCGKKVFTTFIKEEKVKTDWSEIEDKNVQSKTVEGATSQETEVSVVPEVLSAKLADEASDNIYPQLNLSGKEEIKKESEDQFEVPMKKTEEKEIGIITTDKTTELLEEQTIDTYASPLVKEFQEEEKSEKFQKDKISDISISQSSKVEQYLESRTSEEYNIDLDTEILSKEEKDSSEVVKSLSEIEDKFIESLRVTEEIEIPEPIPDLTVKETTVEEVPEEKITEKQSITEILDSSDYEIKSEIVTITEQCSTKDIIHDAKFDDDSKKLKEEKAKIVEFIEPLSEIKKTEEIQYSKSLPSEVIDKTELLSDDGKKKSVEELIHSKSEMKETLIKETGATESTLLSYDVKTEISKLQEEESVIESIPDITIPESAPCITKQENFEDIKKQDEQKEETAVIDDIMPESTQHEFIDVSDLEDIEPELEIKAQPIVTTPVIERKLKTDRTQRKTHISVADVTEKYADTEVKHTEPIIFEPSDDDKESFGIECHHSTPDFRQMTDIDLEAILEEHAKEEQRRAASESIDTEEHDLTLLDKKEPEDLSVKSPIDIHSPISQSMPPISPPISLPKLDESECHSILSTDIDSCADIKTSHSKSESPLIPDVVDEKIEEQKLISENEYSDQEVFYAEPSSDITDAVQKTTDETSQSSIICEPESEAQIKYRTQMAFDNTAFMGIDNIDVGEAVNREMVRSPYEVVRMKFEDFEIGMTTEQSSVVPEEQVLSEEKISKLEIKEDKYESESVDKSLEIPSREEATKIAQEIIEEIRTEVAKSPLLQNASIKIPDEDDIKTDSQIFASDDKEIMPDMIQSDDGKLIPGEEIFPAEIETSTTKTDEIKPDDKIKELSYEKADETTFPTSKTFQLTKESMEIKESHIFITNGKIEAISSDVDLITDEYDNRQFPVSEEIDYTEDFHSQMSYIGKQDTSTKSVKETESFTSHANLNGPVAVSYIPEYDDETFTIEKIKETDVIDVTKDTFYDISQKSARQDIPESDLMHSENIENAFEESVSASDIKETEIFNEEEYIRTRISISDDQVDQEIKKILSDESQTEDDRLTDIIERPITPEPSDEILEEMLLPESEQLSKLATITQKTISISEEEICVKHTESEMIYPHQNVFSESETDEPTDITVNKFYETALTVDLESREGFPTESVFQQESAEIMEEAMDIGSDKCSDDIEETDNKTHFEYGVHFAAEPHYDEIPKYVESGYGDLYTHQEEDEEIFDEDLQESKNLIENNKQMFSDLDVLLGPKLYTKSGEHDDSSMSSLQEFERLEAEIATGRKLSQGSVDSLNGRPSISKSGEHDDVSMNSLTEFERLERECAEAERIESVAREEAARLSEIEEGHESQASETSQETLSGPEDMDSIDSDDYEKRLSEIDEIIRQAQTNVESFQVEPMPKQSLKSIRKTEIKSLSESLEKDIRPIDQIPSPTPKEQDSDSLDGNLNNIVLMQKETKELDICITELTPAKSSLTVESHDANEDSLNEDQDNSLEHDSLHEVKDHEQDSLKEDKTGDVDSLQEDQKILMQDSLYEEKDLDEDSLRESLELPKDELDVSQLSDKGIDTVEFDDSLHEECIASSKYLEHEPKFIPSLISSTDSLEPSSSTAATHATYQFETDSIMSSSLNSIQTSGEETLMASSTDSLDPNRMMQAYRNVVDSQLRRDTQDMYLDYEGNVQSAPDQTKSYMDKEGNIHPVSEIVKKLDVTNQTCVLNVSEEDQNIIDSIEESKTIKSLKDDTTSSKEYVSLDTTRIQSNVVTKDLSLTLTKDDVQDEEIDEEGNIIEKGKSPDVMHDSDEDDKDQTSISEDSLQKQVEDRFSDTKVISSRKGGEQVEEIKTVDELGNIRIIRRIRHIVTVQRDELSNPDIEKSEQAEPEVEETRTTDDKGNVKIIRRSRRIIKMPDSQSSDIDKHLQEFVQKSSVSDDSQITSPDVSQTDSLQEKYFQDPRCESPITRDMLSGRESVASIRSDFSDADSEIREIKTTDEKGNIIIRRIRRIVTPLPPDSNPSSGRESPYLKEPSETVEERRTVDEKGNVIIKRIRRIVKVQTKDTSETSPIPLVDNEELAKSDTACEESEPEECKFVDEDGNIKHIRRIKKIIKIPQTSNDEEALINDLLQKSEISDSISESSETFYKSDSKLINHVDHGGEETEKHLVQVKKSSSDDTQEPSIEEKFKDFLKKSIAQDSKDEKHEERIIDDKGNVVIIRTVKTSKVSEPKIHSQKFTGPDAEKQSLEFIKSFDTLHSTSQLQQYEATDGEGNIVRVTQEISAQPHVHSVSFSGESYEQDMESYMKNYEEKMHSSEPGSSPSISKSPTSVSNINVPYSTMKTTTHSVDESPIHTLSGTVSSSDTLPIHHEETKLMSEEIDNKELVQSYDSDDAIDSEEDEIIDYLKRGTSSFKEVEPPSDSKNGYSEESAKQL
ncbi:ankyrin-2-like isoform X19 [Centruroides vittatus]|uniref:ankyrin-2-like isoform X19 n=1 Tax=Centruroides vittatus TaxID=120091 RepID=UPI00350F03DB